MDKKNTLTPAIQQIVIDAGTEAPHSGCLLTESGTGTFLCRRCGHALYRSESKFESGCGWPSFDAEIKAAIKRLPDPDGRRTEIRCNHCEAHLGHVFLGEAYTDKNIRHCVNSLALDFVEDTAVVITEEAILAAGCFWGVEYYLKQLPGVLLTEVGYTGGHTDHPTYQQVCQGDTGHREAVRVIYDVDKLNYTDLLKCFFEIHDPTQVDGQGPDLGVQYQSVIYYFDQSQKKIAEDLIAFLKSKNIDVKTVCEPATIFWSAEEYHQAYYFKQGKIPYCHARTKRFD